MRKNSKKLRGDGLNSIRREQILEFIKARKAVSLKELSQSFSYVSNMTLHRDLDYLENNGDIERVRGGAKYIDKETGSHEPAFVEREISNREKKDAVVKKALGLVHKGSSIYLDSGSTIMALSKIIEDEPLSVVTNSPNVALSFADKNFVNVTLCGGTLNKQNLSLCGSSAKETLEKINIDVAFLVASGYSRETGFTCGNDGETVIKNLVCKRARSVVLLIDSTKLDVVMPFTFATLCDVDYIVCDEQLPYEMRKEAENNKVIIL